MSETIGPKTLLETVTDDPVAFAIANELAFTRLASSPAATPYYELWQSGNVLDTTIKILRRITNMGYEIIPKINIEEKPQA